MSDEAAKSATSVAPAEESKLTGDEMSVDAKSSEPTEKPAADTSAPAEEKKPEINGADDAVPAATGADDDVEMAGTNPAVQGASTETNGTPVAGGKKPEKARRKSTGVPEHKTKKLNKKKSKAELHVDARPGELYLARMKGHPAWPSIICDDEMLPEAISKSRPVTAPNADGTWRRDDYAPGGKRHNERTFAIMFLYTNEFAWIPNGDLTTITAEDCKDVSEKNKSKNLLEAYREASKGHPLEHYKGLLDDHANALAEEEANRAEREAEKARKADKKAKRKSEAAAADEMDVDDGGEEKPKSKKRKKEAGADDNEKPAKTPKTTKLKLSMSKTSNTAEKSGKKKDAAKAGKKKGSAKAGGSDDDDTPADEEKVMTPEEKHDKLREEIRYCRHKLQRSLLSRDSVPSDEEVKNCEPWLKRLEGYPDLAADIIINTKIHKVLKGILKLPSIPKDEEYSFKKRSGDLLRKWNTILSENPQAGDEKAEEKKEANGSVKAETKEKSNEDTEKKDEEEGEKPAAEKAESDPKSDEKANEPEKKAENEEKAAEKSAPSESAKVDEPEDSKSTKVDAPEPENEASKPAEGVEASA